MKTSLTSVTELRDRSNLSIDLFICCASYESRSLSVPNAISKSAFNKSILAFNEDFSELIADHKQRLQDILGDPPVLCRLRTDNPILSVDSIVQCVDKSWPTVLDGVHVVVDVTTFTRESLLMLLNYLWTRIKNGDRLTLFYNRAKEYDSGQPEGEKWLSRGIRDVRSIVGYPGQLLPSRDTHLIVMAGFEDDRALRLIADSEPALVSLGIADSAETHTRTHQPTNERRFQHIQNIVGPVDTFVFSAYDAEATAHAITAELDRHPAMNKILAPMNTKISTIGAAMVGLRRPEVQLCYAQAEIYNYRNYSEPGEAVYELSFFGEFDGAMSGDE